jgi:hypothetical protein
MNLVYPVSTWELPIGSIGCCGDHHLRDPVESISVNVGERTWDVKESGSRWLETTPKSSNAQVGSQRGHSSPRAGKPSTWRRATA